MLDYDDGVVSVCPFPFARNHPLVLEERQPRAGVVMLMLMLMLMVLIEFPFCSSKHSTRNLQSAEHAGVAERDQSNEAAGKTSSS